MMNIARHKQPILLAIFAIVLALPALSKAEPEPTTPHKKHHKPGTPTLHVEYGKEFSKFLKDQKIKAILLVDEKGQIQTLDSDGKEPDDCGKVSGTNITGTCHDVHSKGMFPSFSNTITIQGFTPPNTVEAKNQSKATAPDPCIWMNIGGDLIRHCY